MTNLETKIEEKLSATLYNELEITWENEFYEGIVFPETASEMIERLHTAIEEMEIHLSDDEAEKVIQKNGHLLVDVLKKHILGEYTAEEISNGVLAYYISREMYVRRLTKITPQIEAVYKEVAPKEIPIEDKFYMCAIGTHLSKLMVDEFINKDDIKLQDTEERMKVYLIEAIQQYLDCPLTEEYSHYYIGMQYYPDVQEAINYECNIGCTPKPNTAIETHVIFDRYYLYKDMHKVLNRLFDNQ